MDSDIDQMPLLGNNKLHTASVEDCGDETLSVEGHDNLREIDGRAVTPTNRETTFERKAALINA